MRKILGLLGVFLLTACGQNDKPSPKYFDFEKFISDQVNELSQRRRVLGKTTRIGGISSDSTFIPTLEVWNSEMEVFNQLDLINLPAYQKQYKVENDLKDPRSNLKIRQYSGKDTPVPWVKFYYQEDFSKLKIIEARLEEKNMLFTNSRVLRLELDDDNGHLMIHQYSMNGFQKMILNDSIHFSVNGTIDW